MIQEAPTDEQYAYVHIRFLRNGYRFTNDKEMSYIPYLKYCRCGEDLTIYGRKNMVDEFYKIVFVRGGADKSLARPGRKQATATKLGFYS